MIYIIFYNTKHFYISNMKLIQKDKAATKIILTVSIFLVVLLIIHILT